MAQFFDEFEAKRRWESDRRLQEEFDNDLEAYLAYAEAMANGQVKIISRARESR